MSELSATLIKEFQYRGDADHSKEVKKAFVSAFLAAEEKVCVHLCDEILVLYDLQLSDCYISISLDLVA